MRPPLHLLNLQTNKYEQIKEKLCDSDFVRLGK